MARTHGSTSNLTVKFPTLVKALGAGYEGNVIVNRNWFTQAAEQHGYRVQVFPTGKASKAGKKTSPKKAKPPTPKYSKTNRHKLDTIEVGMKGEVKTKKPRTRKKPAAKPAEAKSNVINLDGESFTVKPVVPAQNQPF